MDCRVTVDAPPERVFPFLTEPERVMKWMSGVVKFERLTEGPLRVGSQLRQTRRMMGHDAAEVFEVREWDPPRSFALFVDGRKGSSRKGEFLFRYRLVPRGGGTEVLLEGEFGGMGKIAEFFGRLFSGMMRRMIASEPRCR